MAYKWPRCDEGMTLERHRNDDSRILLAMACNDDKGMTKGMTKEWQRIPRNDKGMTKD